MGLDMHEYLLWLPLAVYPIHVLEEEIFGWKHWAQAILKLKSVNWIIFDIANLAVMFFAISTAMIGWNIPELSLSLAALMYINAICFHILPTIVHRTLSPGTFTALLLFLPTATWVYYGAYADNILTAKVFTISFIIGLALMASPILMLKLKEKIEDNN